MWGKIPELPYYEISDSGVIRNIQTGHCISPFRCPRGYVRVSVVDINGKKRKLALHRLLAMVFIPNPEHKPDINHINGVKFDNRIENLEWCTRKENMIHAVKTGLMKAEHLIGGKRFSKLTREDILYIRSSNDTQLEMGKKFGLTQSHISSIRRGVCWANV